MNHSNRPNRPNLSNRLLLAAALLLPLAGLAVGIATRQAALSDASQWAIPIAGYDPRDPLRGRYIAFTYAWQAEGSAGDCPDARCSLCLSRRSGAVVATIAPPGARCPARVDLAASAIQVRPSFGREPAPPAFASRIFVSESSAPALEQMLRERPMQVITSLTADGRLVNRRLQPAP